MCSSPQGSYRSTVNKPRPSGLLASMGGAARSNYTAIANAADNNRARRQANKQKPPPPAPSNHPLRIDSAGSNLARKLAWYHRLWQFFY